MVQTESLSHPGPPHALLSRETQNKQKDGRWEGGKAGKYVLCMSSAPTSRIAHGLGSPSSSAYSPKSKVCSHIQHILEGVNRVKSRGYNRCLVRTDHWQEGRSTVPVVTWHGHVHPTLQMARRTPSRVDYPLDIPNGNKAGQVYLYHVPVPELLVGIPTVKCRRGRSSPFVRHSSSLIII